MADIFIFFVQIMCVIFLYVMLIYNINSNKKYRRFLQEKSLLDEYARYEDYQEDTRRELRRRGY